MSYGKSIELLVDGSYFVPDAMNAKIACDKNIHRYHSIYRLIRDLMLSGICLCLCCSIASAQYEVRVHRSEETDISKFAVKLRANVQKASALGSGVNTERGIVTAAHVVEGHSEFLAECDGEKAVAKVSQVDKSADVALLSVTWKSQHEIAKLAESHPAVDDELTSVGRTTDGTVAKQSHSFLRVFNRQYVHTGPSMSGRSGSGIFNRHGKLVGIVCGNLVDEEPYVGYAATRDDIAKLGAVASAGAINWRRYSNEVLRESVESGKPLLVVVGAKSCGPCRRQNETMATLNLSHVIPIYIDSDKEPDMLAKFAVGSLPTTILVDANEQHSITKKYLVGQQSEASLRALIGEPK